MTVTGKNHIMIFGPKPDGTYVVEFRTAAGEVLVISIPRSEAAVRSWTVRSHLLHSRSCRNESRCRLSFLGASNGSGHWIAS
jgi:hypothetical protein